MGSLLWLCNLVNLGLNMFSGIHSMCFNWIQTLNAVRTVCTWFILESECSSFGCILNLFGCLEWSAVFSSVCEARGPSVCIWRCSSQSAGKSAGGEEWPWQECRLAPAPWCLRQTSSEMECTTNECLRSPSVLWQTHRMSQEEMCTQKLKEVVWRNQSDEKFRTEIGKNIRALLHAVIWAHWVFHQL